MHTYVHTNMALLNKGSTNYPLYRFLYHTTGSFMGQTVSLANNYIQLLYDCL